MCKNNAGVSLFTLIITIVSIVILAGIALFNSLDTPDNAMFSKFSDEVDSLRISVGVYRARCLVDYDDENYGFNPVQLVDAPEEFISFSGDASDMGYVIDLDLIDFKPTVRGKGDVNVNKVTFGKDDVFVYDKNGRIYYAKGFSNSDKLYYNATSFK